MASIALSWNDTGDHLCNSRRIYPAQNGNNKLETLLIMF